MKKSNSEQVMTRLIIRGSTTCTQIFIDMSTVSRDGLKLIGFGW